MIFNNIDKKLQALGNNEETKRLTDLKKNELAKNKSDMDLGIAIDQAFDEAVKNGFKGSKIDFIKSAPIKLLRSFLAKGGRIGFASGNGVADGDKEKAALGKRVRELMDEGFEMGEAVRKAMSEGYAKGGRIGKRKK